MPAYKYDQTMASEESLLLDCLNRIKTNLDGYFAVHLHLSRVRANNKPPNFFNIASRIFDSLIKTDDATLFPMANTDMILVCRDISVDDVDVAIEEVRRQVIEDPLAINKKGNSEDRLATWFDLSSGEDFDTFLAAATDLAVQAKRKPGEMATGRGDQRMAVLPLSPSNLTSTNVKLEAMRVADLIRRQACLKVSPGCGGVLEFRELFISMNEVSERLAEGVNLFASPWLFQYLTKTLDRRVISTILKEDYKNLLDAISINLNISTVLSKEFEDLHRVAAEHADKVIVELQFIDILADMRNYTYARDSLQERGYRVVVDGLSPLSIEFFDPAPLKSNFLKVAWGPEFDGNDGVMRSFISSASKDSVILARVESQAAVKWGLNLGISRFQGFYIDQVVQRMGSGKQ